VAADGSRGAPTHVAVLARQLAHGHVHAAVYPSLRAGRWLVHDPDDDSIVLVVDVPGGVVTQAHWPGGFRQEQPVA
jgi:ClpP class serine protease